ncbi:MAG TPA: hypothetical protein VJV78_20555 [Polyangiales bacterium]|nr:hypothetical protein [Polyangiales bacterium]
MSVYAIYAWGPPVVIAGALAILAVLLPLMAARLRARRQDAWLAFGACLSAFPLLTTVPQDGLTFFVSLGACGLVGPWVAEEIEATGKLRRLVARSLWRMHGVYMPLLFVPMLFVCQSVVLGGGASALDRALPVAEGPVTVLLNAPFHLTPHYQADMRKAQGAPRPPLLMLYAGGQPVSVRRSGERSLELRVERSWMATPIERLHRAPFHAGDSVQVDHMLVRVRDVDPTGAPTRVDFTFDYSLEDPRLAFLSWQGRAPVRWWPPPQGEDLQLAAVSTF